MTTKRKRVKVHHASRTDIVKMFNDSKGRICTVTYTKKDGETRVMNCNKPAGDTSTALGYILVNDMQVKGDKKTKSIDPRTITEFKSGGKIYRPKD